MNREDIIRMAREAGAVFPADGSYHSFEFEGSLERFAALVAAAEREECAKVAEQERKPLTDEELEVLWDEATNRMEHFCSQYWDFARAIERAHGIEGDA